MKLLKELAKGCARVGMVQGLRPSHLSEGWDLNAADVDYIEKKMGRKLSPSEWEHVKEEFKNHVFTWCKAGS